MNASSSDLGSESDQDSKGTNGQEENSNGTRDDESASSTASQNDKTLTQSAKIKVTNSDAVDESKKPSKKRPSPSKPSNTSASSSLSSKSLTSLTHEAIAALNDRSGSSIIAIAKWIVSEYPEKITGAVSMNAADEKTINGSGKESNGKDVVDVTEAQQQQLRTRLLATLKTGIRNNRFAKVKCSYKISSDFKAKERAKRKKAARMKQALSNKHKEAASIRAATIMSGETMEKENGTAIGNENKETGILAEEMARKREEQARKDAIIKENQRKGKERVDRLRRRRFPIEDTKLHAEDKDLNVKPPEDVISRPYLPYFWSMTRPFNCSSRAGKTSSAILAASKIDSLDVGSRGLVSDLLQVYHFYRGDVHYAQEDHADRPLVPAFTLQNLVFATEQIMLGHTKSSRMLPPLIVHLFCISLHVLLNIPVDQTMSGSEQQLRLDLHKYLAPSLSPASWPDILVLYMDAMERYFTTDASRDSNVLPGLSIDIKYLLAITDDPIVPTAPSTHIENKNNGEESAQHEWPDGYFAYLGDNRSVMYRAQYKLFRQEAWLLTAEEIMSLLRALVDDILASHSAVSTDIAQREEEMQSLLKAKRSADAKFRKVRVAFEGPKRPLKKTTVLSDDIKEDFKNSNVNAENTEFGENEKQNETFKPTATKKQFEAAKKAQQKSCEAYEKGIRRLVARTEPIGYDRNFNSVYCFRNDPEVLYVEDLRPPLMSMTSELPTSLQFQRRSWHVIEKTSLFDTYVASLDIRGKREHDLYEELMGPQGAQQSLRRHLYDDVKEEAKALSFLKEKEALIFRLEAARIKCDEEKGRRSGRLATQAEEELSSLEVEVKALEHKMERKVEPESRDYMELTGLTLLQKFDSKFRMATRRSREKKCTAHLLSATLLPAWQCSKLVSSGHIDDTGIIGMIVSALLEIEEHCEKLAPWELDGKNRKIWVAQLENAIVSWNDSCSFVLTGPGTSVLSSNNNTKHELKPLNSEFETPAVKKRRLDCSQTDAPSLTAATTASILSLLKQPLLDLEERVAALTNITSTTQDADLADDNLSSDGSENHETNKERLERVWKKLISQLRTIPTKRHTQIREKLVAAITASRKAHLPDVVAQLRSALLLYQPNAAGECKSAALQVLESQGGFVVDENDAYSDDEDEAIDDKEAQVFPSVLAAEAAVLVSSLDGSDDSNRKDWANAVKLSKTLARLASLATGFVAKAKEKLRKIEEGKTALSDVISLWEKGDDKGQKNCGKNSGGAKSNDKPSEIWANVFITDDICMVKGEDYPWWPAKKCEVKDTVLAETLSMWNRSLVALIGELGGLRIVENDKIRPFTGTIIHEDESNQKSTTLPKDLRVQLEDCVAMARRISRGQKKIAFKKLK